MTNCKKTHIAIFSENKFECLQLIIYGWLKRIKMMVLPSGMPLRRKSMLRRLSFIGKYVDQSILEYKAEACIPKGIAYKFNHEVLDLALKFFEQNIKRNNKLIAYYNNIFNTNKFEAYVKKIICSEIYPFLTQLYFIKLFNMCEKEILIIKNPLSEFIAEYMQSTYDLKYRIKWIKPLWGLVSLIGYYAWLFVELINRGIVLNRPKKEYKLSKEAVWGFSSKTLRDDVLIDNDKFKKEDILFLRFIKNVSDRDRAFTEARKIGFDTVSIPDLKININKNAFAFLCLYILVPVKVYLQLFFRRQLYFFYYIFLFHQRCFPLEILMNRYKIKCYISTKDGEGVDETIVFNKYGTKNIIFHWCDLVAFKAHPHAFISHNIYFTWGDIYYNYCADNSFVDEKINIGCIYKKKYNLAVKDKERLLSEMGNLKKDKKIVSFFDTSFDNLLQYNGSFFMEYMNIMKEFCEKNQGVNVLFKPKNPHEETLTWLQEKGSIYKKILQELSGYENFVYLDWTRWSGEEVMAVSDVCINMAINSPVTIALICGKNGLYFDPTGNRDHPFTQKYMNKIIFEDKDGLFNQIDNILEGRFNCREIIGEQEIRGYDAFSDDKAIERISCNLHELTSGKGALHKL
ncbi:MAG: hypothetical protein ABIH71_06515 [Candidatus Omnitrophota bacterium]